MENKLRFFYLSGYSSIFSVFASLALAYSLNLIYLIGDERQEPFLFLGIIIGALIYSLMGSIKVKNILFISLLISIISYLIALYLIFSNDMMIDNNMLFIASFLITSTIMPSNVFFNSRLSLKSSSRILFSLIISALFILIILIFAIIYTISNQTVLPYGILFFAILSIIISIILFWKSGDVK
jgi:hypothetical protein